MNLFKTKFGVPVTFGKTNNKQINIFKYWYILWFEGLDIRHNEGNKLGEWKTLQEPYINYLFKYIIPILFGYILGKL